MKHPILIIIPSLKRPASLAQCLQSFVEKGTNLSDYIIVSRDTDGWIKALNSVPMDLIRNYEVVGIINDDVRMRTTEWDRIVSQRLRGRTGLVYGRDGIQNERLSTQPFISAEAILALDTVAPKQLTASMVDNFWYDIFMQLGRLDYAPEIFTEHLHPSVGKSASDEVYATRHAKFEQEWHIYQRDIAPDIANLARKIPLLPLAPRKKVISFSLWGDDPKYVCGARANAELSKKFYPGWTLRCYCEPRHSNALLSLGYEVQERQITRGAWEGLFWRFEPAFDPEVDIFISRDLDSRLNPREMEAVKVWMEEGRFAHVMRDHPEHNVAMLGGMWGCRRNEPFAEWFKGALAAWPHMSQKGTDTAFLCDWVWPRLNYGAVIHDSVHSATGIHPFPPHPPLDPRIHGPFVGAIMLP